MAQVPQDLIFEILLPLPVKSLLRFRCVSKPLCALIDSPDFINLHLCKSSHNLNFCKLIFWDIPENRKRKYYVCDLNLEEDTLSLEKSVSFPWKPHNGHCNGLILLGRGEFGFSLWNPSTRHRRNLPDFSFGPNDLPNVQSCKIIGSGLGYDDSVDEYKALIMVNVKRKLNSEIQVWICGLKSNVWKRAQDLPYNSYMIETFALWRFTTDGSLNWLFTRLSNHGLSEIVSFDLKKETFSIVPLPVSAVEEVLEADGTSFLHVLEGCLSVSFHTFEHADLYIGKKDGVDIFTWTKLFSFTQLGPLDFGTYNYFLDQMYALGYLKGRDKILLALEEHLVSYDPKRKSFVEIGLDKDPTWWLCPFICLESLVSVGGGQ